MYEEICYAKPFLKEVIVRLDFAAGAERLTQKLPSSVTAVALRRFPISEPRSEVTREVLIEDDKVSQSSTPVTTWNFHGRDREKRLAIGQRFMFVSFLQYTRYEDLTADFLEVFEAARKAAPELLVSRFGLRYINSIEIRDHAKVLDWSAFINGNLLGQLAHFSSKGTLTRSMSVVEMRFDDIGLRFQFGMPNPDYPAPIKQPLFVLDLDASANGLGAADVAPHLAKAHEHIQALFEDSITGALREAMVVQRS